VEDKVAPGWEPILSGDNDTCVAQLKSGLCEVRQARHVEAHTPKRVGIAAAHLFDQFVYATLVCRHRCATDPANGGVRCAGFDPTSEVGPAREAVFERNDVRASASLSSGRWPMLS
jgi:hypothetical protein